MSEGLKQKILEKAQSILNRVDEETILTITEKGNIKRFLSYFYDDVNAALDEATKQIREKRNEIQAELEELLPKQDNPAYPIFDIDMEVAFRRSELKLIDNFLAVLDEEIKA